MRLKRDEAEFRDVINQLISGEIDANIPRSKRWLPKYVYHFTDINNAVSILNEGKVYSRNKAIELGIMSVDNANSSVIDNTNDKWKSHARFYFRPKTPTQFRNEGIRYQTSLEAHCPVPIFLLFNSIKMLTMENSSFSHGNLAANDTVYNDAKSFREMPFKYIYHEGSYDTYYESHIKFNRHAELVIPDSCGLEHLEAIVCRSAAEKDTFLNQLSHDLRIEYRDMIQVDTRNNFYNGKWTYIEKVTLNKDKIVFSINKGLGIPIFNAEMIISEDSTGLEYIWEDKEHKIEPTFVMDLSPLKDPTSYDVKFYLDNYLVYQGMFFDDDSLPF